MKMVSRFGKRSGGEAITRPASGVILAGACLALALNIAVMARAQVEQSADRGGAGIWAGGMASGTYVQYGERKMVGVTGFVDADTRKRLGIEAEGRWVQWRQSANVYFSTYSVGVRYHFNVGQRWQPYAKGLVGFGDFNFPYNLATGSYLVVTAGGGVDFRLTPRITIRAADVEYQDWPQFTYGAMTTASVSSGIKVRIY